MLTGIFYSFRADFTILMGFQEDFGDQAPDESTQTMVKLEENYRSPPRSSRRLMR